jgi:hypothetical protein
MRHDEVHFGGPDVAPGRLRDLLAERVAAVPAGGSIDFITYYFRDRRLAAQLLAAKRRGAAVRVTLDGRPRSPHANDAVIQLLAGPGGLGDGLRVVRGGRLLRPRLHEKLYCFSHPRPAAFVGSFNPSGDLEEADPELLGEIGDQDRGYNLLVELRAPALVEALALHARAVAATAFDRFTAAANRAVCCGDIEVHLPAQATSSGVASTRRRRHLRAWSPPPERPSALRPARAARCGPARCWWAEPSAASSSRRRRRPPPASRSGACSTRGADARQIPAGRGAGPALGF